MMASTEHIPVVELPVRAGIRIVALKRLDNALSARERLVQDRDAEALHDFRVAMRRLRSGLRAYRPWFDDTVTRSDRRSLKQLAAATGEARDIEVQISWLDGEPVDGPAAEGIRIMRHRLEAARRPADRAALRAAHRFPDLAEHLRGRFLRYTAHIDPARPLAVLTTGAVTADLVRSLYDELRRSLDAVREGGDAASAHRARIEGKRLRYLVEPFEDDVAPARDVLETLEALQDDLGALHDCDVLIARTAAMIERVPDTERDALAALAAHLATHRAELLQNVREGHLADDAAKLGPLLDRLALELEEAGRVTGIEIERKFLLNGLPRRRKGRSSVRIDQGWLPGTRINERIRRVRAEDGTTYLRTIKSGRGLVRREVEEEIDESTFRRMWPLTKGLRISKRRYSFRDGERVWTVDRFLDYDVILAEIELESPDDDVEPPEWLGRYIEREVTGLAGYQNVHLATLVGAARRDG